MLVDFIWKQIGILGGMGPEASAEFYRRIIRICQNAYGARDDADFPPIVLYNLPLPDVVESDQSQDVVWTAVQNGLDLLTTAGSTVIAIPCNTVFGYFPKIGTSQILNIVEETYKQAKKNNLKRVGILCTKNTARKCLYENVFADIDVVQLPYQKQEVVTNIILRILEGIKSRDDTKTLQQMCCYFQNDGVDAVVLGCTELPLILSSFELNIPLLDTLQILAESTVIAARGGTR